MLYNVLFLSVSATLTNSFNPSYQSQDAITLAEKGDYSGVRLALKMLKTPFEQGYNTFAVNGTSTGKRRDGISKEERKYASTPPAWADSLLTTCSS